MNVLIVAATAQEIEPMMAGLNFSAGKNDYNDHQVTVLITGVGMVATAFSLGQQLEKADYDLAINLGIAGSFDKHLVLGEVVHIISDRFSELGAEDGDSFLTIDELGFGQQHTKNNLSTYQLHNLSTIPQTTAITVNSVHGNEASIAKTIDRFDPQVESMEGAAFFYACNRAGVPCVQVRAISNYVERRNRDSWNIGLAIKNLNIFATGMITAMLSS